MFHHYFEAFIACMMNRIVIFFFMKRCLLHDTLIFMIFNGAKLRRFDLSYKYYF